MSQWHVLGIDPGKSGGVAIVGPDTRTAEAWRYPGDIRQAAGLIQSLPDQYDIRLAVIEKVGAMPGQGVTSMFNFGMNYGQWHGLLAMTWIPMQLVAPGTWQKRMIGKVEDTKAASLEAARALFPQVDLRHKADNGKSDALLIARWGVLEQPEVAA